MLKELHFDGSGSQLPAIYQIPCRYLGLIKLAIFFPPALLLLLFHVLRGSVAHCFPSKN